MRRIAVVGMVILAVVALPVIAGAKAGDKPAKVTVCHLPDDGGAPHEIVVNEKALPAHIGHGDVEGNCDFAEPDPPENTAPTAVMTIDGSCSDFYPVCTFWADADGSIDPDGDELTYYWEITGPATASGSGPVIYMIDKPPGTYTVTLTVSDGFLEGTATGWFPTP